MAHTRNRTWAQKGRISEGRDCFYSPESKCSEKNICVSEKDDNLQATKSMKRIIIHHHKICYANNRLQKRKPNFELVWF